ncbi:cellulose synthase operon protein YhjQ [Pantoea agglomerans]|uniref:cellulose biosynthesis protein BcsQ n=1 Tax=Enterobacter agglomerans TaxID=549 RepID=UPI0013CF946E|nr:cellulose biosynthesis protein BcsQ [Pantoea agglomerans]NEG68287.1 cellulose synthase operon protein YhjQ [Pantoea agglomerans]
MPQIALQGVRGGVGTTSLCAGLGWALAALGERVLLIDGSPVSQLGVHFNLPAQQDNGWMKSLCEGGDWQHSGLRYPDGPDLLPHGVLSHQHALTIARQNEAIAAPLLQALPDLRARYQWIIFDLPADTLPWHETLYPTLDSLLCVTQPDANCHLRLSQRQFPARTRFIINQFNANSRLQQDLHQLWMASLNPLIPLLIHRDEALAEALMMKQPVGEYRPHALVSEEIITLASWLLLNLNGVSS